MTSNVPSATEPRVDLERLRKVERQMREDWTKDRRAAENAWAIYIVRLERVATLAAGELCVRMKVNFDAPTCRSPVKGEGLPREEWCRSCEARELIGG